jgi:hexulose-6-phosphate isomerase
MKLGFMQGRLSPIENGRVQSFPWGNWRQEFSDAEDIKFHAIEWTIDSKNYHINPIFTRSAEICELMDSHRISVPSVTNDHFMEMPPWVFDKRSARDNLLKLCEAMPRINASILVIPLVDNSSIMNDELRKRLIKDFFLEICDEFKKNSISICFELDLAPTDAAEFINDLPAEIFGINYDIGNSASLGYDPKIELSLYGHRVMNVHVKDRSLGGSTIKLGSGCADFDAVFTKLNELQYSGNYVLQTARALDGDHAAALEYSKEFVENQVRKFYV